MTETDDCKAILVHLREEHRRLNELVRDAEQLLASPPAARNQVLEGLQTLRNHLQSHFDEEEKGGCMDTAVRGNAELAHEVTLLEHEHPELLKGLDEIIEAATADQSGFQLASKLFQTFMEKLAAHEQGENQLLAHGFGLEPDEIE